MALVAGVGLGVSRHLKREAWQPNLFTAVVAVLDIQVLLGAAIYIVDDGWDQGTFIGLIHPLVMIAAVAVAHVGMVWARNDATSEQANRIIGYSLFVSLILVILAIPWF